MKLLFDLTATQPSPEAKFHGGGRYAENIFFRLLELKKRFSCIYDSTKYINPGIVQSCEDNQIQMYDISRNKLNTIIEKHNFKVFFSAIPNFMHKEIVPDCTIIGTLHGLRDIETPINKDIFKYEISLKLILKYLFKTIFPNKYLRMQKDRLNALFENPKFKFITVSNHSKYSILSFFPNIKEEDIKVYYSPSTTKVIKRKKEDIFPYFLLVSGNRWIKNNYRAIIAFDELFKERPYLNFKVIVTGVPANHNIKKKIKNHANFIFYEYVNDDTLTELYANAYCFVYPSINEGFGYPPLEAMAYGVPVISSPITSISEICGNASLYFNPFSISEIKNRILMILNPDIHSQHSSKSLTRYKEVLKKQEQDIDALIHYICNVENNQQ